MQLKAYAKINIYLKVLDRLDNGYHKIISLFQKISLYDKINIEKNNKGIEFDCSFDDTIKSKEKIIWDNRNILYKVVQKLEEYLYIKLHYKIKLEKNIPLQAGLGGGSSDAASLLKHISDEYNIPEKTTYKIAQTIGSDVPFFLQKNNTYLVSGLGNIFKPLEDLPKYDILLIQPDFYNSTKEMYNNIDYNKINKNNHEKSCYNKCYNIYKKIKEGNKIDIENDFEQVLDYKNEKIIKFKNYFNNIKIDGTLAKGMTGSGSVFYIIYESTRELNIDKINEYSYFYSKIYNNN